MKKIVFAITTWFLVTTATFAQFNIGVSTGLGFIVNDRKPAPESSALDNINIPVQFDLGISKSLSAEKPKTIIYGLRLGYLKRFTMYVNEGLSWDPFSYSWQSASLTIFNRLEAGLLFADIGVGLHAWTMKMHPNTGYPEIDEMYNYYDLGAGFTASIQGGAKFNLSEKLVFRTGLSAQYLFFKFDTNAGKTNIINVGLLAGLSLTI
jgi:hypothetical protein